jgi:hypothetical protein
VLREELIGSWEKNYRVLKEEVSGLERKTTGIEIRGIGYREKFLPATFDTTGLTDPVTRVCNMYNC